MHEGLEIVHSEFVRRHFTASEVQRLPDVPVDIPDTREK